MTDTTKAETPTDDDVRTIINAELDPLNKVWNRVRGGFPEWNTSFKLKSIFAYFVITVLQQKTCPDGDTFPIWKIKESEFSYSNQCKCYFFTENVPNKIFSTDLQKYYCTTLRTQTTINPSIVTVWPDVEIKSSSKFFKSCPKRSHSNF